MQNRNFQMIETNGIRLRTVVEGSGPLVVLLHGWPQCWYLWRHQIDPLVAAGFQVAVPDQRGYGGSDKPEEIEAYNIIELTNDVVGIADALGHDRFIVVGHDWGAPVAWHTALLHPERVKAVAGLSVPYTRWKARSLTEQEFWGDNFWYMVYFQQPGVAEAELETDIPKSLRTIYYTISGDLPADKRPGRKPASAKFLDGMTDPEHLPEWLTEEDLDYYVEQYRQSGFRGPINWYRNIDRNVELTPQLESPETGTIRQPAFFIAGTKDPVLQFHGGRAITAMDKWMADLRGKVLIEGAGHWVQMERPAETTEALLGFLKTVA
ncbi:MAG: alpha/beta fold hydrolase [Blastocatellales bacterium]